VVAIISVAPAIVGAGAGPMMRATSAGRPTSSDLTSNSMSRDANGYASVTAGRAEAFFMPNTTAALLYPRTNMALRDRQSSAVRRRKRENPVDGWLFRDVCCDEQTLTDRFGKHSAPTLEMRCSRLQLQHRESPVRRLPCVSFRVGRQRDD